MAKKEIPTLFVSKAELVELIHGYMQKYKDSYTLNILNDNDHVIQFQAVVFTLETPALIHAFYKNSNGFSLSYRFGKNQHLGKEIVEGVYKLYGIRYNDRSSPKAIILRPEQAEAVIKEILDRSWETIETLEDTQFAKKIRLTTSYGEKLVVSYWPSNGKFFPQTSSPAINVIIHDIIAKHIDFSSLREINEKLTAIETGNQALLTRAEVMESYLGYDILRFLFEKNKKLLNTFQDVFQAFIDARTYPSTDYSSIVQRMGRCFEGLMKTLFSESNMPYEQELKYYFSWDNKAKMHYLNDTFAPSRMSMNEMYELGRLYKLFSSTRNPPSHGDDRIHHTNISTYEKAKNQFEKLVDGGKETYLLMKHYL